MNAFLDAIPIPRDVTAPRPASAADLLAARELVAACALPLVGLDDQFPDGYAVIAPSGRLVGLAGVEAHGDAGLLRSVAVATEERGRGHGEALVRDRLDWARSRRLAALYLLTTSAAPWFARLGFAPVPRRDLPASLAASRELVASTCASATAMALALESGR